jgi:hypothetical protein
MDHWPVHLHRRAFAAHVVCAGFGASLPLWPPGRFAIYRHVKANYLNDGPRNYLEFVVHQGESFRRWLQIETHAESRFTVFEPVQRTASRMEQAPACGPLQWRWADPCRQRYASAFHAGLFQQTLRGFLKDCVSDKPLVVRNESDLYSLAHFTLPVLNDILLPGSLMIFDEFASPLRELRARPVLSLPPALLQNRPHSRCPEPLRQRAFLSTI